MQYVTAQGDTFDTIAQKCYGDSELMEPILKANAELAEIAVFDFGTTVDVPEIEKTDNTIYMPPWRK